MNIQAFVISQGLLVTFLFCSALTSFGDGLELGRWRINTGIDLSEAYTSNIYLEGDKEKSDYVTSISPELSLDFALASRNYLSLLYSGKLEKHSSTDNHKAFFQQGSFRYSGTTNKGSKLSLGTSIESSAIQPYSDSELAKDYLLKKLYGELVLTLGEQTELGVQCSFDNREFESSVFASDDYQTNTFSHSQLYRRYSKLPILIEYRLIVQDNDKQNNLNTDYISHTLFVGSRWQPGNKLTGFFRIGYTFAKFEERNKDDLLDYAFESNVSYMLTEKTSFELSGSRKIMQPTKSARDIGDYYIATSGGFSVLQSIRDKLSATLAFIFQNNDFRLVRSDNNIRKDNLYKMSLLLDWQFKSWMSFTFTIHHQTNDSDVDLNDYAENYISLSLSFSL